MKDKKIIKGRIDNNLKKFELDIIDIGFLRGGDVSTCGSCAGDNDRICSSICPTNGCRHDGCCGSNYDAGGEPGMELGKYR